jgi:hypothetical protein
MDSSVELNKDDNNSITNISLLNSPYTFSEIDNIIYNLEEDDEKTNKLVQELRYKIVLQELFIKNLEKKLNKYEKISTIYQNVLKYGASYNCAKETFI